MESPLPLPTATRLEVIDASGRRFIAYYPAGGIDIHVQDDGRTVKLLANGFPSKVAQPVSGDPLAPVIALRPRADSPRGGGLT